MSCWSSTSSIIIVSAGSIRGIPNTGYKVSITFLGVSLFETLQNSFYDKLYLSFSQSTNFIIAFTAFTILGAKYAFVSLFFEYAHIKFLLVLSINKSVKYRSQLTYSLLSMYSSGFWSTVSTFTSGISFVESNSHSKDSGA